MMDVFATSWCHPLLLPGIPSLNFSTIFNASTSPSPYGLAPWVGWILACPCPDPSYYSPFQQQLPFNKINWGEAAEDCRLIRLESLSPPNRGVSCHRMGLANFNLSSLLFPHHHTRSPCRRVLLFLERSYGVYSGFAALSAFGVS